MDNRLIDLEIRYTHLESQIQELSQVVFAQQRAIDTLSKELVELRSRLEGSGDAVPIERPPHY
jgi:SlyX protein